jgi:hypothetical protein
MFWRRWSRLVPKLNRNRSSRFSVVEVEQSAEPLTLSDRAGPSHLLGIAINQSISQPLMIPLGERKRYKQGPGEPERLWRGAREPYRARRRVGEALRSRERSLEGRNLPHNWEIWADGCLPA